MGRNGRCGVVNLRGTQVGMWYVGKAELCNRRWAGTRGYTGHGAAGHQTVVGRVARYRQNSNGAYRCGKCVCRA